MIISQEPVSREQRLQCLFNDIILPRPTVTLIHPPKQFIHSALVSHDRVIHSITRMP